MTIDYIFLMHGDRVSWEDGAAWDGYLSGLRATGCFQSGSAIGGGVCVRRSGSVPAISQQLTGFIRVCAENIEHARTLLIGNPVFEAGGTVEIRELPRSD